MGGREFKNTGEISKSNTSRLRKGAGIHPKKFSAGVIEEEVSCAERDDTGAIYVRAKIPDTGREAALFQEVVVFYAEESKDASIESNHRRNIPGQQEPGWVPLSTLLRRDSFWLV